MVNGYYDFAHILSGYLNICFVTLLAIVMVSISIRHLAFYSTCGFIGSQSTI